jgi:transposase
MSVQYHGFDPVPDDTARVARAAFPKGSLAMQMRDTLYGIYGHWDFEDLFAARGRPAECPWRLALVTVLQFVEGLADRQAAEAVRSRIDWKYLLGLELTDPGFDFSVLSEFRSRLLEGRAEERLLTRLLDLLERERLLRARGRQRTDSTHVLAAVRTLNRLELVGETLRHALNSLAVVAPGWLGAQVPTAWFDRYGARVEESRLPRGSAERQALAASIGADGHHLLALMAAPAAPVWLGQVPAVQALRQVWLQQYYAPDEHGQVAWRATEDQPPAARLIASPYDVEARYGAKRSLTWLGAKVHVTETCEPDQPHLLTQVETTPAPQPDEQALGAIQADLTARDRRPGKQLVDGAYVSSATLVSSQTEPHIDLVGPAPADTSWQARAGKGFAATDFHLEWDRQTATCPAGVSSQRWQATTDKRGQPIVEVAFPRAACAGCAQRPDCTRAAGGRVLELRPQAQHEALQAARQRQTTAAFKEQYRVRAGVEGTLSQGVRACGLRRARYVGLAKTHLQHVATAAALNVVRAIAWLEEQPRAQTRRSAFAQLAPLAAA